MIGSLFLRLQTWVACGVLLALLAVPNGKADTVMYGALGGHNNPDSENDGALALVDPATAAVTVLGQPQGAIRLTGIAFDSTGRLFATTIDPAPFPPPVPFPRTSELLVLDRNTGAILMNLGRIKDASSGEEMSINRIAIQPGTDRLFAMRSPEDKSGNQGTLYTIDKATGRATFVGRPDPDLFFGAIAFAPNGTLYMAAAFLMAGPVNPTLKTLDPLTGQILTSVDTEDYLPALGVRPEDGVLFAGTGDEHELFTVDPQTGNRTLVGDTGRSFISSLSFGAAPIPEPGALALLGVSALAILGYGWRRRSAVVKAVGTCSR